MRAVIVDAKEGLVLGGAPDPTPRAGQCLVRVEAFSLNRGDLKTLPGSAGFMPGWDAAGEVVRRAQAGERPSSGTRVVTFGWSGGWVELRAADVGELAELPEGVDVGEASALPVAGVTALKALQAAEEAVGGVAGKRVVVTGASGGVGRFAVRLARIAGARVVAMVGRPERGEGLEELGAEEVPVSVEAAEGPVAAALDTAGAEVLERAFSLVEEGGVLVSISGEALPIGAARGGGAAGRPVRVGRGPRPGPRPPCRAAVRGASRGAGGLAGRLGAGGGGGRGPAGAPSCPRTQTEGG